MIGNLQNYDTEAYVVSNFQGPIIRCLAVLGITTAFFAQTPSIQLPPDNPLSEIKAGVGDELVRRHCALCHSTDYIVRQPHLNAQRWDAEVRKMITTYGAPISDTDAKVIADYLAKNYGEEGEPQKPSPPNPPIPQSKPSEDRPRVQEHAEGVHGTAVAMDGVSFRPQELIVKVGETVTWTNKDPFPHNVTSATGAFKSEYLDPDQQWQFRVTTVGRFSYKCTLHPGMSRTLIVEP